MRTVTILTITTTVLGFLGMTLLISGPPFFSVNPAKWMQEERLEVLSASSGDLANAALPHEEEFTGNSPLQLAKVLGRPANQPGNAPRRKN